MLHKSFKPAKCKTSLKMASSRTKLLKNKKEVQVKHLRRELAQLLESGQDQTARIRVEHVVREEKMMTAYELIEIFCELIAARMQIIESQKNCPMDLKEAVASVVFASPRCSDIPELMDVRKHFAAKYGKEFVSAAVELRPDCGVNRNLIEKLSAKAPDGQTKLKILTTIAEEHNIKWDPKSFGDKDTDRRDDLLNGPNSFQNASQMHVEPSNVQSPYYDRGPPNVHISPQNEVRQEPSPNIHSSYIRTSPGSHNVAPVQANVYASPRQDFKSSGAEMEHGHGYSTATGRPNWNMEFKDATSAAQAAAESAEMASMAARAAAELSSMGRITTPNSSESHEFPRRRSSSSKGSYMDSNPSPHHSTHELPRKHPGPSSDESSRKGSFKDSRPSTHHESQGSSPHHTTHELPRKHPVPSSDGSSSKGSFQDSRPSTHHESQGSSPYHSMHELPRKHSGPSSDVSFSKGSFKDSKPSTHHESQGSSPHHSKHELPRKHTDPSSDGSSSKGSFKGSRPSVKASTASVFDEGDIRMDYDPDNSEDPEDLAMVMKRLAGNVRESTTLSRPSTAVKSNADSFTKVPSPERPQAPHKIAQDARNSFEGESSDNVKDGLIYENVDDFGEDAIRAASYAHSFSRTSSDRRDALKSSSQRSSNASGENPFADLKGEDFHEDHKAKTDTAYVVFDDYDEGESFDLDKGLEPDRRSPGYQSPDKWSPERSKLDPSPFSREQHIDSVFSECLDDSPVQPQQLDDLPPRVFDDVSGPHSESEEEVDRCDRDQKGVFRSESPKPQHALSPSSRHSSFGKIPLSDEGNDGNSIMEKSDPVGADDDGAFYLGNLPGGRRNKISRVPPPYTRTSSGESSSGKLAASDDSKKTSYSSSLKASIDSESSQFTYSSSNSRLSLERPKLEAEVGKRSSSRASVASLDSDPEDDSTTQTATTKPRFSGISRRTKGTPSSNTDRASNFKSSFGSDDAEAHEKPKRSSFTDRSSDMKSSFRNSPSSPSRNPNLNTAFASEDAETQEHHVDTKSSWRSSNVKSRFSSEEVDTQEVKPSRIGAQEHHSDTKPLVRSSYTDGSSTMKSSSRGSHTTERSETSTNVQPDTNRSSNLKLFTSGSEVEKKSSPRGSSYITQSTSIDDISESVVSNSNRSSGRVKVSSEKPKASAEASGLPNLKTVKPSLGNIPRENSLERASHVHPKLPADYDSFAAHFQALRSNRQ